MPPKRREIKSVRSCDRLTLACEWGECDSVYADMDAFQLHITCHLKELDPDGIFEQHGQLMYPAMTSQQGTIIISILKLYC